MKENIIKIACLSLLTLFATSCDSYLDITPVGKVIPQSYDEFRDFFNVPYSSTITDRSMCDIRTDDVVLNNDTWDQNSYRWIERYEVIRKDGTSFQWRPYYSNIYFANHVIDEANKIKGGTSEERSQLVGEAFMMRALMHFNLVNIYGRPYTEKGGKESLAVPIRLDKDLETTPHKSSVEAVYRQVIADATHAITLMNQKQWDLSLKYRFSIHAAQAFLSRVYLYMGDWENSYKYSQALLQEYNYLEDLRAQEHVTPCRYDSKEVIQSYEQTYDTSTGRASRATDSFVSLFDPTNDLRYTAYFVDPNPQEDDGKPKKPVIGHRIYKINGLSDYRCSFRVGEVYLNAAEAAYHLDKPQEAKRYLLTLLEKRYTPQGFDAIKQQLTPLTGEELLAFIYLERRKELAFEGHRWFDLRRTTRPMITKKVFKELTPDGQFIYDTVNLQHNDPRYTIGIPQEAVQANPNLND